MREPPCNLRGGELSEWPKEPDSKSGVPVRVPRVRIPRSPPRVLPGFGSSREGLLDPSRRGGEHLRWEAELQVARAIRNEAVAVQVDDVDRDLDGDVRGRVVGAKTEVEPGHAGDDGGDPRYVERVAVVGAVLRIEDVVGDGGRVER